MSFLEKVTWALVVPLSLSSACADDMTQDEPEPAPYEWNLPPGFPAPVVPEDNPMSADKVELGRYLFYDQRLSANQTQSCGSCHEQALAFADGEVTPEGSTGEILARNSFGLSNSAYSSTLTWASPLLLTLEEQALIPMFGEFPVELGITGNEEEVLARFAEDPMYVTMFAAAFPDEPDPIRFANIAKAIASFVRTMISGNSAYDRYAYQDDKDALSESQLRGMRLFFEERLECHHCHGSFNFTMATYHENSVFFETSFNNTGLYNIDGMGAYPIDNTGLYEITGEPSDMGKFKAPTLRNIALTGPYMHDGSIETLEEVLDFYAAGGRLIEDGPYAGDGRANPYKSGFITGFTLTEEEREDVLNFLDSLTDETFITDPRFANPFE